MGDMGFEAANAHSLAKQGNGRLQSSWVTKKQKKFSAAMGQLLRPAKRRMDSLVLTIPDRPSKRKTKSIPSNENAR
ncbi:hypothetical protein [Enterobacter kobei]|uniref:hypothetical protein n=1 Tax=Enterobacter kobei TaxID=208224 RepID=UPI0034A00B06